MDGLEGLGGVCGDDDDDDEDDEGESQVSPGIDEDALLCTALVGENSEIDGGFFQENGPGIPLAR